jgi:hypothetical protein
MRPVEDRLDAWGQQLACGFVIEPAKFVVFGLTHGDRRNCQRSHLPARAARSCVANRFTAQVDTERPNKVFIKVRVRFWRRQVFWVILSDECREW